MATKKEYTVKSVSKSMKVKVDTGKSPDQSALQAARIATNSNRRMPVVNPARMTEGNKRVQPKSVRQRRGVR